MQNSKQMAKILGGTGLIPIFLADVGIAYGYGAVAASLGTIYVAIILGFLGAIHWGLALDREQEPGLAIPLLLWSVIPALWGFFSLWFTPALALILLIVGFVIQWLADWRLQRRITLPAWFFPLRSALSIGMILLLLAMLAEIYFLHP